MVDTVEPVSATENLESIQLKNLREGDLLIVTLGEGEEAFLHEITILDRGERPLAQLQLTAPDGSETAVEAEVVGAGNWTTHEQNPVQTELKAMSIGFGSVYKGGLLLHIYRGGYVYFRPEISGISVRYADHTGQFATEADIDMAVAELIDGLVEERAITFNSNGFLDANSSELHSLYYRAICEGFGFPPGFTPDCHNWLYDDLDNEAVGYMHVRDQVDLDDSGQYWQHRFDRRGLEQVMRYWYDLGNSGKAAEFKFPWISGGVSADEFVAMSRAERDSLNEALVA